MEKETNPTWNYFKLLLFVLFLGELVLFLLAFIFGRVIRYDWTFKACIWLGLVLAGCFALIVLGNMLFILAGKVIGALRRD